MVKTISAEDQAAINDYKARHEQQAQQPDKFIRNGNGSLNTHSASNVATILEDDHEFKGRFKFNEFTNQVNVFDHEERTTRKLKEFDETSLQIQIERKYRYVPTTNAVHKGIEQAAHANCYNPIHQWITRAKWDGVKRVAIFFIDYLGAEDCEYTRAVTETWFTGLIARAYKPGVKLDIIPVLIGKQGLGKSSLIKTLVPEEYFTDELKSLGREKDDLITIHDTWIVELGEMKAAKHTDNRTAKAFLVATSDKIRLPYGHMVEDFPRSNVFIGTANEKELLTDLTGNRRYFPISCEPDRITKKAPGVHDHENKEIAQVLAEAHHLYFKDHHSLEMPESMQPEIERRQGEATQYDLEAATIVDYVDMPIPSDWDDMTLNQRRNYFKRVQDGEGYYCISGGEWIELKPDQLHKMQEVTTKEILIAAFGADETLATRGGRTNRNQKISVVLKNNGWEQSNHITLFGKKGNRGYKRIEDG